MKHSVLRITRCTRLNGPAPCSYRRVQDQHFGFHAAWKMLRFLTWPCSIRMFCVHGHGAEGSVVFGLMCTPLLTARACCSAYMRCVQGPDLLQRYVAHCAARAGVQL